MEVKTNPPEVVAIVSDAISTHLPETALDGLTDQQIMVGCARVGADLHAAGFDLTYESIVHDQLEARVRRRFQYRAVGLAEIVSETLRGRMASATRDVAGERSIADRAFEATGLDQLDKDASVEELASALRQLPDFLANEALDDLSVATLREALIRRLSASRIKSAARMIDSVLPKPQKAASTETKGNLNLADPEPWEDPVGGARLLDDIVVTIKRFVVVEDGAAEAAALWVAHTYLLDVLHVSPKISVTSPTKRCGKTTLLSVLGALASRALPASSISAAAVFRAIDKYRPTLLVDEADTFLRQNDELRGVLNSGHTRTSAFVVRCAGDDHEATIFSTWGAVAIACIGNLPDTLADRSVEMRMRRKAAGEAVERWTVASPGELAPIRRRLVRWTLDHAEEVESSRPDPLPELDDRAADNWLPLLSIADVAGGEWPDRARRVAVTLSRRRADEDEGAREMLLADIRDTFDATGRDRLPTADILDRLHGMEERPWPEWRKGKPLSPRGLASLLKPFGIKPSNMRDVSGVVKGYTRDNFDEAWTRYLSATPLHPLSDNDLRQNLSATQGVDVADRIRPNSNNENDVADVAAENRGGADLPIDWSPAP